MNPKVWYYIEKQGFKIQFKCGNLKNKSFRDFEEYNILTKIIYKLK